MSRWRYFSEKESFGLVDDLMIKLDYTRELFGHPITITSGYRSAGDNAAVGGVENSAHVFGKAVDIAAPVDAEMRERLLWAIGLAGFDRVGAYARHFHIDVDYNKPSPVFWIGEYK